MTIHMYQDYSNLNARYDAGPMLGLGAQHTYLDTAKLNAPYSMSRVSGLGCGPGSPPGVRGCAGIGAVTGNDSVDYPWREYSGETSVLQSLTNDALDANGYCKLTVDGKLGPATCGAVKKMLDITGADASPPSTCESFTSPSKKPCGGGYAPPTAPADELTVAPRTGAGMSGDTMWLVGGGLVAALAIGTAFYVSKKKRGG